VGPLAQPCRAIAPQARKFTSRRARISAAKAAVSQSAASHRISVIGVRGVAHSDWQLLPHDPLALRNHALLVALLIDIAIGDLEYLISNFASCAS
jgi:hypothetical protein